MVSWSCPTLSRHSPDDGRHLLGRFIGPPQVVGPTKIFTAPTPVTWIYCVIPLIPKTVSYPVHENFPMYCKTCPVGADEGAVHVKGVKAYVGHNLIFFGKWCQIKRDGVRDELNEEQYVFGAERLFAGDTRRGRTTAAQKLFTCMNLSSGKGFLPLDDFK